ncbi:hypothetical protein [Zongyangia hominis]|uniref:Uncharacterized protein n=1 Tax=Zongyangia hominis TaxID=2763677 RepID=A0A926IBA9_9FIRM|nr:hypothetical protein [Zongyangia hominis]MBC8569925.1 hypothetical protein [Zongyangia hominis]
MMNMAFSVRDTQRKISKRLAVFEQNHPDLFYLSMILGMPLLILLAVFSLTAAVMFPLGWLFGWL